MKLTVLLDNNTLIDRYFLGEPGVSCYIQCDGKKILFDCGYSDAFLINARKMGIDLLDLDMVVLSHGHLDHTWGLDALLRLYTEAEIEHLPWRKPKLVAHPLVFSPRKMGETEIGAMHTRETLARFFDMELHTGPFSLTTHLVFLGQIERKNTFEAAHPLGTVLIDGVEQDDYILDDTALACTVRDGLVIITGCSHAGICNIVEQAHRVCAKEHVADIIGGFHLLDPPAGQLAGTLAYMETLGPDVLHACHCTDLKSKIALAQAANLEEVGVGLVLEYENAD
jgi:7,8-dihydropterin-6-yl-methyl-4-(beta-D-ribofuranosyl)aminobenzene 5'-phosphate synthase